MKRIRHRLSVRLSLLLSIVVVPSLAMVATLVIRHEGQVVEALVLQEAQTAALQGAASVGSVLDNAVDEYTATCLKGEALSKDVECMGLSMSDILEPPYEEIKFFDKKTKLPIHVADKRFRNRLSEYVTAHGIEGIENAAKRSGNFLFSTAMDRRGFVPRTHGDQCQEPRGDATEADAAWDRIHSRCGRMYDGAEQIAAAGYLGNDKSPTLTQPYPRDTGEMAWDVAAPIYVKGQHFGGFRVGVARDRVVQQYHDLTVGLSLLFGLIAVVFVGITMLLSYRFIKPLSVLSDRATELSMSGDPAVLDVRIKSTDPTEIGDMARSLDRLRNSLSAAMDRIEAHQRTSRMSPRGAAPEIRRDDRWPETGRRLESKPCRSMKFFPCPGSAARRYDRSVESSVRQKEDEDEEDQANHGSGTPHDDA